MVVHTQDIQFQYTDGLKSIYERLIVNKNTFCIPPEPCYFNKFSLPERLCFNHCSTPSCVRQYAQNGFAEEVRDYEKRHERKEDYVHGFILPHMDTYLLFDSEMTVQCVLPPSEDIGDVYDIGIEISYYNTTVDERVYKTFRMRKRHDVTEFPEVSGRMEKLNTNTVQFSYTLDTSWCWDIGYSDIQVTCLTQCNSTMKHIGTKHSIYGFPINKLMFENVTLKQNGDNFTEVEVQFSKCSSKKVKNFSKMGYCGNI